MDRTENIHSHTWGDESPVSDGTYVRHCLTCGDKQKRSSHSLYFDIDFGKGVGKFSGEPESVVATTFHPTANDLVSATSMGGFVAFDFARERVQMRDGGEVEVEMLAAANHVPKDLVMGALLDAALPRRFFTPQQLAAMQTAVSGNPLLGAGVDAEGAMVLIIETVRNAGSPDQVRAEGRKWLTKITTQITAILAELDE